ncbi:MAG: OmpA family protein [Verrucomicrobiales bacterium]
MSQTCGNSSTPVIAIISAVGLSVALFFIFTLPNAKDDEAADGAGDGKIGAAAETSANEPETTPPSVTEPETVPDPEPVVKVEKFSGPEALVAALARRLSEGKFEDVANLVGEEVLAEPRALGFLHSFQVAGYVPQPSGTIAEIGDIDERNRWALNVVPKADAQAPAGGGASQRMMIDVTRAPEVGWKVAGIHVPVALRKLVAGADAALADSQTEIPVDRADPLFVADDFVNSLLSQNFEQALSLCGEKVPDEKIAGLCMVFEDGEFRMLREKPLTTTSLGAAKAAAWVFARVRSDKLDTNGEFAVELKINAEKGWEVENVNIESMLQDFVKGSEAGRVPYTPIKTNPDGGETLVLYFEYDKAELLPRSLRQIDILSRILKADPSKTLNIGGHADALGSDEYNRKLSEARGVAVRAALVMFGVPESQILVTAFGEAKPWKENTAEDGTDNPEGRQHNRRAEIYLNF